MFFEIYFVDRVFQMKMASVIVSLLLTMVCVTVTNAQDLSKENIELKQRVTNLEKELAELKSIVLSQATQTTTKKPLTEQKPTTQAEIPSLSEEDFEKLAAIVKKNSAESALFPNIEFKPYGYIKWDASYDSSRINPGNYAKWVDPEGTRGDDDQFNMTANQTRLGMRINSTEDSYIKSSGLIEVDFFGNGSAENKPGILIRHAYAKLDWPEERFSILAGQTWDVISPLNPSTLNYSVQWWGGNIGYRRPQIRATKSFEISDLVDIKAEGALTRNIGFSSTSFPNTPGDAGEDSGTPGFQGRLSTTFPLIAYEPTTVGFSGHWAEEELDTAASGAHKDFDSWSLNLDVTQPVNKWLAIKGELFTGKNLSAYLGGVGQGINTSTLSEIRSRGGWIAAALGPWDKWEFNAGYSVDDPDNGDLRGISGARELNRAVFGNVIYSINKSTQVGFELSHWNTDYRGQKDSDSIRAQTSLIYKF